MRAMIIFSFITIWKGRLFVVFQFSILQGYNTEFDIMKSSHSWSVVEIQFDSCWRNEWWWRFMMLFRWLFWGWMRFDIAHYYSHYDCARERILKLSLYMLYCVLGRDILFCYIFGVLLYLRMLYEKVKKLRDVIRSAIKHPILGNKYSCHFAFFADFYWIKISTWRLSFHISLQ